MLIKLFGFCLLCVVGYIVVKMIYAYARMDLDAQNEQYIEKEVQRRVRDSIMSMRLNVRTKIIEDPLGHEQ